jgi:hypothetical protein
MNINGVMQTQFRKFSGTTKIAGISLPDFNDVYIYTKSNTTTSETVYKKAIVAQAIKDRSEGKFQNDSQGFNQLMKRFVSQVSPDRKAIITQGLKEVEKNKRDTNKTIDIIALFLTGKIKYQDSLINDTYAEFYDSNGEMVASYSNGGWTMFNTKEETARQVEICSIYNDAWRNATKTNQGADNFFGVLSESKSVSEVTFDRKA